MALVNETNKMEESPLAQKFRQSGGKHSYVQRLFGRIAPVYDLMNRLMSAGLDGRWRNFAARKLALEPGEVGLDLGAGTADLSIAVLRHADVSARMIGLDITPEMLKVGQKKLDRLGLQDRIDLRVGDAEQIDLPDNSVDGCCSAFTVRNLSDIHRGFREMRRVVRPGGRVVCLEISHPPGRVFGALFHFYFYKLAPLFGSVLGKAVEEYHYLPESLKIFPDAPALQTLMEECGWAQVQFYRLANGMVAVHIGVKPAEYQ